MTTTTKPTPEPYFCVVVTVDAALDMRDTLAEIVREAAPLISSQFSVDSGFLKARPNDREPSFLVSIATKELPSSVTLDMIGPHLLTEIPGAYHVAVAHCADMRTLEELSHKAYTYGREGVRTEILTPRAAGK